MITRSCLLACALVTALASHRSMAGSTMMVVSVPDQKLVVLHDGAQVAKFAISTSRFGIGDRPRSYATPLGSLEVASKIGGNSPLGAVFHGRRPTGEVLAPNAQGRDPIVTRILCLRGLESQNANAFGRGIYIHGTPQERLIGRPASFGCIRMRSRDILKVYDAALVGTKVKILNLPVSQALHNLVVSSQQHKGAV